MDWVYILYSQKAKRFYCGSTNDLNRRIAQHNDPNYRATRTTKRWSGPWSIVWQSQQFDSRAQALKLERKIKKRGIARFLASQTKTNTSIPQPQLHLSKEQKHSDSRGAQSVESRRWRD